MVDRATYRKMRKTLQQNLDEQVAGFERTGFIAIAKIDLGQRFPRRDVEKAWPHLMKDLGLVEDGTGKDTWTLPGKGIVEMHPELGRLS